VKVYDLQRMTSDDKSSHGLLPGEIKKQKSNIKHHPYIDVKLYVSA